MTGWRTNPWSQGQSRAEPGLGGKCLALTFLPEFLSVGRLVELGEMLMAQLWTLYSLLLLFTAIMPTAAWGICT